MKKFLKILGLIVLVVVLLIGVAAIWFWDTIAIVTSGQTIGDDVEAIPVAGAAQSSGITRGAADWICWRGPDGTGKSAMTGISKDWSSDLERKWEVGFLCQGHETAAWSAPVVQGDRVVVCGRDDTHDIVFCLDPEDGGLLWKSSYEAEAVSSYGSGFRATPWIDDDRVYTFGRSGDLVCWNLLDGSEIWHKNVMDEGGEEPTWGHSTSPLVTDQMVVVNGGGTARTIAYDKMTGDVIWKSGEGPAGYAGIRTMDLGDTPAVLTFHGKGLAALDPSNGTVLFDFPWETDYDVNAPTPLVTGNRVFITSGYGAGCALLEPAEGNVKTLWRHADLSSHHSDPHLIDGYIYGYSGLSMQNRGDFKCLDMETGEEKWSTSKAGWGTCTHVDGHLICCDIKGNLFLVKPDPSEFKLVTSMERAMGKIKGPVWTVPVVANGNLYLRFKQKMVCYRLGR